MTQYVVNFCSCLRCALKDNELCSLGDNILSLPDKYVIKLCVSLLSPLFFVSFYLFEAPVSESCVKISEMVVGLSIYPCSSSNFHFRYFETVINCIHIFNF